MRKCDNDKGCPGHMEKYDHCVIEALHQADPDKETGSVEAHGYYSLYILHEDEEMYVDDDHTVIVPADTYLLMEDDRGFVYDIEGSDEQLKDYFDNANAQYDEWAEANMEFV